jgi:hypothetical protein
MVLAEKDGRWEEHVLSLHLACEHCGETYEPISPRALSHNHPEGACPDCGGLGRQMRFQESLSIRDEALSIHDGVVKPWKCATRKTLIRRNAITRALAEEPDAVEVDIERLRLTDKKQAQDLIGDVGRTITAGNFRTHDGLIRWVKDKRRIPGYANPVAGYFPERVAPAASTKAQQATSLQADSFQADPIPRVPTCPSDVPTGWNGQTLWQETVLTTLFQRSNIKEELKKRELEKSSSDVAVGCCSNDHPENVGTLEHPWQIRCAASDLPVPTPGTFAGTPSEQAEASPPQPLDSDRADPAPAGPLPPVGALVEVRANSGQPWEPGYRVEGFDGDCLQLRSPNTNSSLSKRIKSRDRTWRCTA